MDMMSKLSILADAAKYDASCSSSGSNRKNTGGMGNGAPAGICHSWSADGRCISLLKILMSNACRYDCAYCINRSSNDVPRASFTPREIASLTMEFYRRNYIEGLFLSSAVLGSPDHTMELMIQTLELLRHRLGFNGYIHAKTIPGANPLLTEKLGRLCDRMSVNIELPSEQSLRLLAPEKQKKAILSPMNYIGQRILQTQEERTLFKSTPDFAPAGQTTQMIVGATGDSDRRILMLSQALYKKYRLKRVYFSAYVPLNHGQNLPDLPRAPLIREHRLYQSDWLLRFYGFTAEELLDEDHPQLDSRLDPKCAWALRHLDQFPVEVNRAPYETLLRVPGIGVTSARRIISARRVGHLNEDGLKKLGVVLKRARHFITASGRYLGYRLSEQPVRAALVSMDSAPAGMFQEQLSFLPEAEDDWSMVRRAVIAAGQPLLEEVKPHEQAHLV